MSARLVRRAAQPGLFGVDAIEEALGPRWVVQVNEVLLFCYSGTSKEGREWWAHMSGRPGIAARTTHLIIAPPGALIYIACEHQEEAEGLAGWMHSHGCSPKAIKALHIGHPVTCKGCGRRRPFWHKTRSNGVHCRTCYEAWVKAGCPLVWHRDPDAGEPS